MVNDSVCHANDMLVGCTLIFFHIALYLIGLWITFWPPISIAFVSLIIKTFSFILHTLVGSARVCHSAAHSKPPKSLTFAIKWWFELWDILTLQLLPSGFYYTDLELCSHHVISFGLNPMIIIQCQNNASIRMTWDFLTLHSSSSFAWTCVYANRLIINAKHISFSSNSDCVFVPIFTVFLQCTVSVICSDEYFFPIFSQQSIDSLVLLLFLFLGSNWIIILANDNNHSSISNATKTHHQQYQQVIFQTFRLYSENRI